MYRKSVQPERSTVREFHDARHSKPDAHMRPNTVPSVSAPYVLSNAGNAGAPAIGSAVDDTVAVALLGERVIFTFTVISPSDAGLRVQGG